MSPDKRFISPLGESALMRSWSARRMEAAAWQMWSGPSAVAASHAPRTGSASSMSDRRQPGQELLHQHRVESLGILGHTVRDEFLELLV